MAAAYAAVEAELLTVLTADDHSEADLLDLLDQFTALVLVGGSYTPVRATSIPEFTDALIAWRNGDVS